MEFFVHNVTVKKVLEDSQPLIESHFDLAVKMKRVVLLFASLLIYSAVAQKPPEKQQQQTWLTLNGQRPSVVARGGFSGLFPDSSEFAYKMAQSVSLKDVILYCDLQLSKDMVGFCQTEIQLDNSTTLPLAFPKGQRTYNINGKQVQGWFAVDYSFNDLFNNATLVQNVLTRPSIFDQALPLYTVDDVIGLKPAKLWLNVEYDTFFNQHKLSSAAYLEESGLMGIQYISSPEIGFLKGISGKVDKRMTKLIFKFQQADETEPTTNQSYGSIMKNLASIKQFASGILVQKDFIWPVSEDSYLQTPTTLVADAHKQGLEVYASVFANDFPASYNYSYDPTVEYLQFIDNSQFSVDGVLTDFPSTASEAIGQALIITHNGASGDYAGSTDLAYEKAVNDGADIIDCSVQMTKDGVAFCSDSADLTKSTNAITMFMSRATTIPEIQIQNGILSFDLTWSEIQSLKPQLVSNIQNMPRNPAYKDKGKFLTLAAFLSFAKAKAVSGVLINIKNANYLATKKSLDITDAVTTALSNETFDKQSTQQVLIQSDDSSVLAKFKDIPTYQKVLFIEEIIGDAPKQPVDEIKRHADAVTVYRSSLVRSNAGFTVSFTKVVEQMHAANISVYVSTLYNEFVALGFDYFADPMVEIATYIKGFEVDGIITEYPATASRYMKSPCAEINAKVELPFSPIQPGGLIQLAVTEMLPPAEAPAPDLEVADVVDPPLPEVIKDNSTVPADAPNGQKSSSHTSAASMGFSLLAILLLGLLSAGC
ncbi:hypothetical protein Nepgr_020832 [Nepenthes gracilis]|uniref:glycerophosphodiester phosphodiesterase n=1 Tax=Nepenthes gracilis TaxID=150966 RepID=A0AAD3XWR9_NEPGR|nr:hypothetical protein Nepgr_020832 [Nepenthes gracilis]